jgi:PAS domain S-box-containing protein
MNLKQLAMFGTLIKNLSVFKDARTILLNQDGSVLSVNENLARKKGYSPSKVVGKNFSCLSPATSDCDVRYQDLLKQAAQKGRVSYKALTTENGKTKLTRIQLEAIHDEKKRVIGYAVIL